MTIGDDVFVGPNVILQGSTLHNRAFISMGSTVRHSTVESGGFVAAGSVIADNMVIKEGEVNFYPIVDLGWQSRQVLKEDDTSLEINH